jgi:hypothetical protein
MAQTIYRLILVAVVCLAWPTCGWSSTARRYFARNAGRARDLPPKISITFAFFESDSPGDDGIEDEAWRRVGRRASPGSALTTLRSQEVVVAFSAFGEPFTDYDS